MPPGLRPHPFFHFGRLILNGFTRLNLADKLLRILRIHLPHKSHRIHQRRQVAFAVDELFLILHPCLFQLLTLRLQLQRHRHPSRRQPVTSLDRFPQFPFERHPAHLGPLVEGIETNLRHVERVCRPQPHRAFVVAGVSLQDHPAPQLVFILLRGTQRPFEKLTRPVPIVTAERRRCAKGE